MNRGIMLQVQRKKQTKNITIIDGKADKGKTISFYSIARGERYSYSYLLPRFFTIVKIIDLFRHISTLYFSGFTFGHEFTKFILKSSCSFKGNIKYQLLQKWPPLNTRKI